ncbi:MAG: Gfo/Idh/MocA family oxidoreductase [Anaerolineae bacterium]|nr:Gfo/Idh/MocA family oxidoreductase [Anaerolineae bacterium]
MGHTHTRNLVTVPGVVLHTVVGRTEKEAADFAHKTGYAHASTNLDTALQSPDIDAVVVSTPNHLHSRQTKTALLAGKHVLCELPVAMSMQKAEELANLAQQTGKLVMVCHTERYEPGRLELWRRIRAGELHPRHIIADFHLYRPGACITAEDRAPWYDNALWHHGCHAIDAVLSLLGETAVLDFHAVHGPPAAGSGFPLDWALQWRTPGGVLVSITLSHNAVWHRHTYRLICAEDTLESSSWGTLQDQNGTVVARDQGLSASFLQDQEFINAIREGRAPCSPAVDVTTALDTIRILQTAWNSWLQR